MRRKIHPSKIFAGHVHSKNPFQQKHKNLTSRYRKILFRQIRRGQLPKHHSLKTDITSPYVLALIITIGISTCAAHGMRLQAEGKRGKKTTDEKGPNLRKNQARTENVRVMPLWHGWV